MRITDENWHGCPNSIDYDFVYWMRYKYQSLEASFSGRILFRNDPKNKEFSMTSRRLSLDFFVNMAFLWFRIIEICYDSGVIYFT